MRTIRVTAGLVALGVMMSVVPAQMQDKPFVRVTKEQAAEALKVASEAAKGNYSSLESNFQKEIRKIWDDYDNRPFPVYERSEMQVLLIGPSEMMVMQASSATKRGDGIAGIGWPGGASVYVSAMSGDAPDIVDITVERDGKLIEPVRKGLQPQTTPTVLGGRQGAPRTVHMGSYIFPIEAFDPGGKVVVTAIADTGRKYSKEVFDRELRKLQ